MYLSRLILNTRCRAVQRDIGAPQEMHRTVLRGFPDDLDHSQERVLYRLDQMERGSLLYLLVQSQQEPDWTGLDADYLAQDAVDNPAIKQIDLAVAPGQRLAFRLRANPTKRLGTSAESSTGKRVGIYRVD
jgi:CRISPR system Cascade subunit CasE